ncbi:EAL domain-containing protein [Oxalobacteraceae bacterium CAVE-383]|nr:EAL domain-containing protein [Oxalobacteraceae bacterium CAVE-383]
MNRKSVILTAVFLALLGIALPIAGMLYLSWERAVSAEQARLLQYADNAIARATLSFSEVGNALRMFDGLETAPCSEAHIGMMRKVTLNTRTVAEIGYYRKDGLLACTSWGMTRGKVRQVAPDFVTPDGLGLVFNVYPMISHGKLMTEVRYKNYNALVDPERFADIVLDDDVAVAVETSNGQLLGSLHAPDLGLVQQMLHGVKASLVGDKLIAVRERSGLIAVVIESRERVLEKVRKEQLTMIPLGILMAAFIVAIVIWVSRRRLSLRGELAIAVQRREFVVHYQPLIELKTGVCIGAEALVRWQRPDGAMVRPDLFIPLAEESGLILPITDQVVQGVIADLGALLVKNPGLHIAVNLSAQDIKTGRILPYLGQALRGTGIDTAQIWLEATERGFMDVEAAKKTLEQARLSGHAVSIDDFGTGYSSLSHLQDLPLDALKIDKSFIDTICTDSATSSVTPHIIAMAKSLGLKIVAEGIESQEQADYLLARDVEYGQGWLFSKALPAGDFITFHRDSLLRDAPEIAA